MRCDAVLVDGVTVVQDGRLTMWDQDEVVRGRKPRGRRHEYAHRTGRRVSRALSVDMARVTPALA